MRIHYSNTQVMLGTQKKNQRQSTTYIFTSYIFVLVADSNAMVRSNFELSGPVASTRSAKIPPFPPPDDDDDDDDGVVDADVDDNKSAGDPNSAA